MISQHGYVRVGGAVPQVRAGAVTANVASMCDLARQAAEERCDVTVFPELCVTGYTCADLFFQDRLLAAAREGLGVFMSETGDLPGIFAVGVPWVWRGRLFNVAAVISGGALVGLVPKTYLPGYHEYYEPRWFTSGSDAVGGEVWFAGGRVPFGPDLLFRVTAGAVSFRFGVEVCEDVWAPIPPSSQLAVQGASIILNLSASNDLVGKSAYRTALIRQQSARCLAGYVYSSAGVGESTTDMVFGGDCLIAENGALLARGSRFSREAHVISADVDLAYLEHERVSNTTFGRPTGLAENTTARAREVAFSPVFEEKWSLRRTVDPHPFTPADPATRHDRCQEIFAIQSHGLATRLQHTGIAKVVIGLSGGLDSTLAFLVCLDAFKNLGLDVSGVHAITMPGFGTTDRTRGNVETLCTQLGISLETIPIGESCRRHFEDIGHDGQTADVTYENVQARERTQVLMDKANLVGGLVIGTGDLSELALGWCTYNGDHMSMYAVNCGVPKTLVRFLIEYYAEDKASGEAAAVLRDILATPISPELLPPDENGEIAQKTEDVVGPYELHDFFLYHAIRRGSDPAKVLFLAEKAFGETYEEDVLRHWIRVFYKRFFSQQFKRSCLPDGPKVGTLALSPRGDWRMPSDASVDAWLSGL